MPVGSFGSERSNSLGGPGGEREVGRAALWLRPSHSRDGLAWDPWRERWVVFCRAPARRSEANRAALGLIAAWVGVPTSSVRWVRAGASPSKLVEVDGLNDAELAARLGRSATRLVRPEPSPPASHRSRRVARAGPPSAEDRQSL